MENQKQLDKLLNNYLNRKCTSEEIRQLLAYFNLPENEEGLKAAILKYFEGAASIEQPDEIKVDFAIHEVHTKLIAEITKEESNSKIKHLQWFKIAAAAVTLVFLSFGTYFLLHKNPAIPKIVQNRPPHDDIAPGGNKAILTLANGKKISLTDARNGKLAAQGSVIINKTKDGQLVYSSSSTSNSRTIPYNVIETPRGGQYHLTLTDGTRVWLNAASSLRYPASFAGKERKVELTGEAYFEVEHNAAKPFKVVCHGQTVEDLGTKFNINAYNDEDAVKTTLLEGSLKISSVGKNKVLKPGEQARLEHDNIRVADVDVNEVAAWKNGLFQFNNDNIRDVMRQLGRWYDVDIKYEGNLPDWGFSGAISRNSNLSQVLDILSFLKIHFRIDGKTIVVKP